MRRPPTLAIKETNALEKVKEFLNSKSRNSEQTKKVYSFALSHFQTFLSNSEYKDYNIETISQFLMDKKFDVYSLLDKFNGYLTERQDASNANTKLSPNSRRLYVAGVRSYLEYNDIEISSNKLKKKFTIKKYKRNEEPIDAQDIRTILLSCTNARLKAFLLVLASSGMRSMEALTLRKDDIDFDNKPTKIHVRPEYSKTREARDIYISDEATKELQKFIDSKPSTKIVEELIFSKQSASAKIAEQDDDKESMKPIHIYRRLHQHFIRLLDKVEMDKRKDGQGIQRRAISFHSFRRFVKTTISKHTNADYSEWFLGHSYSTYWSMKEQERRELYVKKCMKYLTFLDYAVVESVSTDFESKLEQKEMEIEYLRDGLDEQQQLLDSISGNVKVLIEEKNEMKRMYLKAMAGHVVMESDLDVRGIARRKIKKQKKKN